MNYRAWLLVYGRLEYPLLKDSYSAGLADALAAVNSVALPPAPPTADSVTSSSGSGPGTTFSYTASDPNGYQELSFVQMMINDTLTSANSCLVWYAPGNNRMYLRSDDGASWLGPLLVGSAGTLQNSRCEVDVGNSSVVSGGTTLTVHLAVQMTLNGVKNNWLWATDLASQHSGWVLLGTWTVGP